MEEASRRFFGLRQARDLPLGEMQAIEPRITAQVFEVLSVERAAASRTSFGGTDPERVREAAAEARERFL